MALLQCPQKNVLPHLNLPLSEYGASKDKVMARIVRDVVDHFQPLCKALPRSVQKQLAEADMALAANASLTGPGKRSRRADEPQPSGAQQRCSTPAKPPAKRPAPTLEYAAEPDVDTSSDASDLPEGVVRNTEPMRPLKRLKRLHEMEHSGSQPIRESGHPNSSTFLQKPKEPQQPSVKVHAPHGTEEALLGAKARVGIGMHELGSSRTGKHSKSQSCQTNPKNSHCLRTGNRLQLLASKPVERDHQLLSLRQLCREVRNSKHVLMEQPTTQTIPSIQARLRLQLHASQREQECRNRELRPWKSAKGGSLSRLDPLAPQFHQLVTGRPCRAYCLPPGLYGPPVPKQLQVQLQQTNQDALLAALRLLVQRQQASLTQGLTRAGCHLSRPQTSMWQALQILPTRPHSPPRTAFLHSK